MGMPRRYYAHLPVFHTGHVLITVGSWLLALGFLIYFGTLLHALFKGRKAEANPWGGVTVEWQIASPPPLDNFTEVPVISDGPYPFPGTSG